MTRALYTLATLALCSILTVGCGATVQVPSSSSATVESTQSTTPLALTAAEMIRTGDELATDDATELELRRALSSYDRAATQVGREAAVDLTVKRARAVLLIVEARQGRSTLRWIARGEALATELLDDAPDRVEGYYYDAVFSGLRAAQQRLRAIVLLPQIEERGQQAVDIDPAYDNGGPLRLMGMLLVSAPAWPHGIGDVDEGLSLLRQSVDVADHPRNRYLLGRALIEAGEPREGCHELLVALSASDRSASWLTSQTRAAVNDNRCLDGVADGVATTDNPGSL